MTNFSNGYKFNSKIKDKGYSILHFLYNCTAHPEVTRSSILPPNTTSKLQPCHARIIQNTNLPENQCVEEDEAIDDGVSTKKTMEQNWGKKLVSSLSAREERAFKFPILSFR